jgi:DinB superfamily
MSMSPHPFSIALLLCWLCLAPVTGAHAGQMTDLDRQRLLAHLDMTARWLVDEVSTLSRAQIEFRPAPNSWTILQVVEHLVLVGPIYWDDLQKALASPPAPGASTNTDVGLLWYGIDRTPTVRERAIPTEVPTGRLKDLQSGLDDYHKNHDRLVQFVKTTTQNLRNHIVARQGSDAYQWAVLISTHEQRHILQIREIKAHPRFPK